MNSARFLTVAAVGLLFTGPVASAQDLSRYRSYALESSVESVIAANGARAADVKTLHQRPARIQELEWRAPYVIAGREGAGGQRWMCGVAQRACRDPQRLAFEPTLRG
jgi:hypothetical protein